MIKFEPWTEKYRPKTLDEFIFPVDFTDSEIEKFKGYVKNRYIDQNYIFFGKGGTGKSTLANILAKEITTFNERNFYKVTGRRIDDIDKLKAWIKQSPINSKVKLVVIDEIDRLSDKAITELKSIIEPANKLNTYFIGLTNRLENLRARDPHFLQRFVIKRFSHLPEDKVVEFITKILDNEGVKYDPSKVENFVKLLLSRGASLREIIQHTQYFTNPVTKTFEPIETQLNESYISAEDELFKLITKFLKILDTQTNPKILAMFVTTFNIDDLRNRLTNVIDKKPKLKPLFELISTYDEISKLLYKYHGKINLSTVLQKLEERYTHNPLYLPIITKTRYDIEYALLPDNKILAMLYEFVNLKYEILKSAAIFNIQDIFNLIKEG